MSSETGPAQCAIRIKNLANESTTFRDTLHQHAIENQPCSKNSCQASVYKPTCPFSADKQSLTNKNSSVVCKRSTEELISQATDFVNQFFSYLQTKDSVEHRARLSNILNSIHETGTYELTEQELVFGVKTAWRNAPRCIGRIQWNNLKVFDCRHIKTTKEMFEEICNHLKYTTNGGNIRSTCSVFPHQSKDNNAFRIWNQQLIRYAGYKNDDGSITGDPITVEFTELCLSMGWSGKRTQFDILPLVLQANGEDPELFDLPSELILEVNLKHPKYTWFEEMGLKWYAVPSVSNMSLDCGGLEFTAAPFNGWYMSSEIGRDLCDPNRYNKSKVIAKRMGLDTETLSSLWIDETVIHVNIATLYSFQQQHVTITDHHSESASFVHFMATEYKTRGGCPADWIWINPPLTASMTPVFHQEMLNYKLKPSFEYVEDAWRKHKWRKNKFSGQDSRKHFSLKEIARIILFLVKLMREAKSRRVQCTILYGTETGKSERFSTQLAKDFNVAFQARVMRMDRYDINLLSNETLLFVVTSTFGDGDPPENGVEFMNCLNDLKIKDTSETTLSHIRYSVFGLGSQAYPKFCAFAHRVDKTLHDLKARRIYQLGEGDQLRGQEGSFNEWAQSVFQASCKEMEIKGVETRTSISAISSQFRLISKEGRDIERDGDQICSALTKIFPGKNIMQLKVKSINNLKSSESDLKTNLVKLFNDGNTDSQVVYEPGDHVGIFPTNDKAMVNRIIDRVMFDEHSPDEVVTIEVRNENQWGHHDRLPPVTVRMALTYLLDITTPPDQMLLKTLAHHATDAEEKRRLHDLSQDYHKYEEWTTESYQPLDVLLDEFSSIKVPVGLLLGRLPFLQPRYYSISSSPLAHPNEIHLTVAVLQFNVENDSKGPRRFGVCSTWLDSLKCGDIVPLFHRSAGNFHLPEDKGLPVLMVGPGTGIAPFRAFWSQRKAKMVKQDNGTLNEDQEEMTLYFGCRKSKQDHLYETEMQSHVDDGVISQFHLALSREPDIPKTYVQDLLIRNATDVYRQIVVKGGHIYVCGDVTMASQVEKAITIIVSKIGEISLEEADNYVLNLYNLNRYHKDVYGHNKVRLKEHK